MKDSIDRRDFMRSGAAVGAGLAVAPGLFANTAKPKGKDQINVGVIGCGTQGQTLIEACKAIGTDSGIRFKAVCDIWDYNRKKVSGRLRAVGYENNAYTDYKDMLATEKDLDAVIVATPDFWHSEHACAAMKAGLNVYCEKEMSNTIEGAREIVRTQKETGKLLQIGHQRRSNPRYRFCYDKVITEGRMLGRMTTINGQWNRSRNACVEIDCKPNLYIDEPTLNKYGFKSMKQFLNWRWYKGLGGGPIVDIGSHQIDIFAWFCGCNPKSVMATGGADYWGRQWYDSVIALYEFETKEGIVRASYQTITTNSSRSYFETFMGDEGSLTISEDAGQVGLYREFNFDEKNWYKWENKRYIKRTQGLVQASNKNSVLNLAPSPKPPKYDMLVEMKKLFHQPHLENFFAAIRGEEELNCPGEIGYETAVAVLKVNEAIEAGRKIEFKPEEFHVAKV